MSFKTLNESLDILKSEKEEWTLDLEKVFAVVLRLQMVEGKCHKGRWSFFNVKMFKNDCCSYKGEEARGYYEFWSLDGGEHKLSLPVEYGCW